MGDIVGVTGTPGTGKKSLAPMLAKKLGVRCISIDELASSYGLLVEGDRERIVDTHALKNKMRTYRGPALLYGHLIPYVLPRSSMSKVVVLRCDPAVLKKRLALRSYDWLKLLDNVEAELIGLISSDAFDAFGSKITFEVDTTTIGPSVAATRAFELMRSKGRPDGRVDWTKSYDTGAKLRSLLSKEES
jgi:adenylate kinase